MKKILFSLMLLLYATAGMAQGFTEVSTLQELKVVIDATKDSNGKSTAKIKLINDIYLNGMSDKLCDTFAGEIDGSYPTTDNKGRNIIGCRQIFGYGAADKDKVEKPRKVCSYLFGTLDGAKIKNVAFFGIRIESSSDDNMGVIAQQAKSTTFETVLVDSCSIYANHNNAGAIVGHATSCTFRGVVVRQSGVTVDGVKAGGLVGDSEGNTFTSCAVSAGSAVFADGNNMKNHGWSGGFAGYSKGDDFSYCINMAFVGADQQHVGGFAGESEGSNFYQCHNNGAVANIDESDFRKYQKDIEEYLKKKNTDLGNAYTTGVLVGGAAFVGLAEIYCLVVPTTIASTGALAADGLTMANFMYWISASGGANGWGFGTAAIFGASVGWIAAAAAIIGTAVGIGINIFLGDDEVGGICGTATGSIFEQCANHGTLKVRDDYVGGIVGLGTAVTINNCLNTGKIGYEEKDTYGSILGRAKAKDGKKCKVTNCFSSAPFTMIGDEDISYGLDNASGNNFRWAGAETKTCDWEMAVPAPATAESYLKGKQIGYLLNNGVENRRAGIAPWYYDGIHVFAHPVLDSSHDEITVESLPNAVMISNASELSDFAAAVNGGEQFKVGVLTADIVMPAGQTWTPIGKNEGGKQFRGIFDGQGHTISGLEVEFDSDTQGAGLFGTVHNNAIIRNVIVDSSCKITNKKVGGAAGIVGRFDTNWYWSEALIENCASYASVNAKRHGGGILGCISTGGFNGGPSVNFYVENCCNMGTITADDSHSALLCGYTKNHGHIRNCWSAGKLMSSTSTCPFDVTNNEMFAGYDNNLDIENCYVAGAEVTGGGIRPQDGVKSYNPVVLTSGNLTYMLNGNSNDVTKSLSWQQNLGTDACPIPGNKGIYHSRNVTSKYGTVCLPYALKSSDDIKYYDFSNEITNEGEVKLKFVYTETVNPGTPVLFRSANGEQSFIDYTQCATTDFNLSREAGSGDWKIHSHPFEKVFEGDDAKTVYYIAGDKIKNAQKTTIAPFRAYFRGPSIETLTAAGAKSIQIVLEDEDGMTTALELVGEDLVPVQQGVKAYSLMGTEVGGSYRGIVIKNGKKVLIK